MVDIFSFEGERIKCNHCGESIPRGIMSVTLHMETCEVLVKESKERVKRVFDKFNNYKKDK